LLLHVDDSPARTEVQYMEKNAGCLHQKP